MTKRAVGVHKDPADKAWEQFEKQERIVERLQTKIDKLDEERLQLVQRLEDELVMYKYYEQHPFVQHRKTEHQIEEEPLPFEEPKGEPEVGEFAGFKGRFVRES